MQEDIELSVPDRRADVEVDEVTFAKRLSNGGVTWTQYIGLVRRGAPETLVMLKLPERTTCARAPGAGPLLLEDWIPICEKYIT
eukprot:196887-Amphidinium_carterae.1